MIPTLHLNNVFRRIEEESRDFRVGAVLEWPGEQHEATSHDRARESKKYTRVLNKPDDFMIYEIGTKFAGRTLIQVDVKYSEFSGEVTPTGIAMGGVIPAKIDENIIFVESAKTARSGKSRERLFVPLARALKDDRSWSSYLTWASNPRNWKPQIVGLNYSSKVRDAGARLTLSAQLGGAAVILQTDYGAQIVRKEKRTIAACKFVPVCAEGIMSRSWYFGLREAIYFLTLVKESLAENAPPEPAAAPHADIVRRMEPLIRLLSYL